jgi:anti-sigma B factor antagonist
MEAVTFEIQETRDPRRFRLVGDLDLASEHQAAQAMQGWWAKDEDLTLDLSELEFMDSTGIRLLLRGFRALQEHGRELLLLSPTPHVRRLFEILNLPSAGMTIVEQSEVEGPRR